MILIVTNSMWDLLQEDNDPNCRQHSFDNRVWKKVPYNTSFKNRARVG